MGAAARLVAPPRFSVHNSVTVEAGDRDGIGRLARNLLHAPLSCERLAYDEEQGTVHYTPKRARHSRKHRSTPIRWPCSRSLNERNTLAQVMEGDDHKIEEAAREYTIARSHLRDPETGLYYRAWDEAKQQNWADPETGRSRYVWARGLGWYAMALVDILDVIPPVRFTNTIVRGNPGMKYGFEIATVGALDFVSLGALVHRMDPGIIPFRKATECSIHVSGGEFNCAANLANCFRMKTGVVSAMVDYPIGDLIAEQVQAMGVKAFFKQFKHNGVNGPNMATVYSDRGYGVRAPVVFYNRSNEAAAQLKPGDIDWESIFSGGVRWFHSGGIFAALSDTTGQLIIEGMKAAKRAGSVVSFDLNFRKKLWDIWGGQERAEEVMDTIVRNVDVLVGNEEDLQKGLGFPGPEVEERSKLDPSVFLAMIDGVVKKYPNVKVVATTLRDVHTTNHHSWGTVAWVNGETHVSPTCELNIYDRVGGGDGFASGLIYGMLTGQDPEIALRLGWAHGALLTTFPGDTTMATVDQVRAFAKGGSARIQR